MLLYAAAIEDEGSMGSKERRELEGWEERRPLSTPNEAVSATGSQTGGRDAVKVRLRTF